jgi:polar amino acid transport system substrate-binding protein
VVNTPFGTLIPGLQAKRYDFSLVDMLDTKEREKVADFVDYIKDGSSIIVRSDDPHASLSVADLCGTKAGALTGSVEATDLATQSAQCAAAGKDGIDIKNFSVNTQATLALISGRIDVIVGGANINAYLVQQNHGNVKQSGPVFSGAINGIATVKGDALAPVLQQALQKLMDDGTYAKLLAGYGLQSSAITDATMDHAAF